jgi:PIN domain nuclease of toxin-antitoxin system
MKALLDTHTFLWWNLDDPQLSEKARNFIGDGYVANRMRYHHFRALPVEISHALHVFDLPQIHADPFDRLLIAQGQMESMPILTADSEIGSYPVEIIW